FLLSHDYFTLITVSFILSFLLKLFFFFFFFNHPATPEIYTLSLHDALPISDSDRGRVACTTRHDRAATRERARAPMELPRVARADRKSTRLNSSHVAISYAVFCLKKKK